MFSASSWWSFLACLLVINVGNSGLTVGLSLRDLKHKGRHHHGTQSTEGRMSAHSTSLTEMDDITEATEGPCCSRQTKFVPVGIGRSGEDVRLDVGHCQKSCTSVPSVMESHVVDFGSSASKFYQLLAYADDVNILRRSTHNLKENAEASVAATRDTGVELCAEESACLPSRSRVQRVSTLQGIKEVSVVEECGCSQKQERCYRQSHTLQLHPGTPYETHLDVGVCSGPCDAESGCRPVKNKTVSVQGPNGVHCHSVIEECSCTGGCYRMSYLETVYDYTDVSDNDTGSSPDVMEIDVGQCTGLCFGGKTQKCLYRDQTDSSKCLASLYYKQSSCTPARFEVYRYTTKDRQIKELISIKDCKCM